MTHLPIALQMAYLPMIHFLENCLILELSEPKGYAEFVASNLNPGRYPFHSIEDPSLKGEIIVISEK